MAVKFNECEREKDTGCECVCVVYVGALSWLKAQGQGDKEDA